MRGPPRRGDHAAGPPCRSPTSRRCCGPRRPARWSWSGCRTPGSAPCSRRCSPTPDDHGPVLRRGPRRPRRGRAGRGCGSTCARRCRSPPAGKVDRDALVSLVSGADGRARPAGLAFTREHAPGHARRPRRRRAAHRRSARPAAPSPSVHGSRPRRAGARAALAAGLPDVPVRDVVLGNCMGPGGDVARVAALRRRACRVDVPALTVDRQCGSGLAAVDVAAALLRLGARAWCSPAASSRPPPRRCGSGPATRARSLRAGAVRAGVGSATPTWGWPPTCWPRRPASAGERQDAYAARSHALAAATRDAGGFDAEVVAGRRRRPRRAAPAGLDRRAAGPAPARVPPADDGGTVTAGNSCGVNDGAAAVALVDAETHRAARSCPGCGCWRPPPPASTRTCPASAWCPPSGRRSTAPGSALDDLDVVELNEAFAGQVLACCDALGLDPDAGLRRGRRARARASRGARPVRCSSSGCSRQLVRAGPRALRAGRDRGRRRPGRGDGGRAMPVIEARGVSHRYGEHAGAARCSPTSTSARRAARRRRRRQRLGQVDVRPDAQRAGAAHRGHGSPSTGSTPAATGREVRRRVGFCFTDPDAQIVMPTVAEDVAFGLRRRGLSKAEVARRGSTPRWRRTGSPGTPTTPRTCSPAGRSSCWRWRPCWSPSRRCW